MFMLHGFVQVHLVQQVTIKWVGKLTIRDLQDVFNKTLGLRVFDFFRHQGFIKQSGDRFCSTGYFITCGCSL